MHKFIPILLMFGDLLAKLQEDGLVEALGLTVNLDMIRCCRPVFNTERGAHSIN